MRIREVFRKHRLTEEELLSLDADGIMDALDYDEELEGITNTVQNHYHCPQHSWYSLDVLPYMDRNPANHNGSPHNHMLCHMEA